MNDALALHTATRRYALEQYSLWRSRYSDIMRKRNDRKRDDYHYTSEALATFPRYNVLNAIRIELERIEPSTLDDLENTRKRLIIACETAQDIFTENPIGKTDERAMADEREGFVRFIKALVPFDLDKVEPLPYRRVLTPDESNCLWARLQEQWKISDRMWFPLSQCDLPGVLAFKASAFSKEVPCEHLRTVLGKHNIERVWELKEYGPEYEQDASLFDPYYDGAEGYWTSGTMDWLIYASHENSITVAGWLLQELKVIWPKCAERLWSNPFD